MQQCNSLQQQITLLPSTTLVRLIFDRIVLWIVYAIFMNRERAFTGESTSSAGAGGLRERTNTLESARSLEEMSLGSPPRASFSRPSQTFRKRRGSKVISWIQDRKINSIALISGLDSVVYGTKAASETVRIMGIQPPRYIWYMLSGACCDIIQLCIDMLLFMTFHIEDASMCWAASFGLSVVFRHSFHRYLVFGDYVGGYYQSLAKMYGAYSVIIVLSTLFNILITKVLHVSHYMAWISTLLWTGIANYFILKRIWSFGGTSSK